MVTARDREDMGRLIAWEDDLEDLWAANEEMFGASTREDTNYSGHLREAGLDLDLAVITLNRVLALIRQGQCEALPQETRSTLHELLWRVWALTHDAREKTRRVREATAPADEGPLDFESEMEQRQNHERFWSAPPAR